MARKKKQTESPSEVAAVVEEINQDNFDLQKSILEDFRLALSDTTGKELKELSMTTSLVHHHNINSLSFLEAVQILSDKYDVSVTSEELRGSIFAGRTVIIFEQKLKSKYSDDEIKNIVLNNKLNLVEGNKPKELALFNAMFKNVEKRKKK